MDTPKAEVKKGRAHYSHDKADARQDKLRQEAEARQREHDSLSTAAKLAKAKQRVADGKGECKKEIAKLTKKLEWEKAQKVTAAAAKQAPMTEAQKADKAVKRAKAAAAHATQPK